MRRWALSVFCVLACDAKPSNDHSAAPRSDGPSAGAISPGPANVDEKAYAVVFEERTIETKVGSMRVWLYAPDPMPESPGLVIVPPAGGNPLSGKRLEEGDRPEHVPYVEQGFIVASFDVSGVMSEEQNDVEALASIRTFIKAEGGVLNATAALDTAFIAYPDVDLERVYAAGHSSAGTQALLFAAMEPRVKAVAAYACVVDRGNSDMLVRLLQSDVPEIGEFLIRTSPLTYADALAKKPVFLFHALDDSVVDPSETQQLFDAMTNRNAYTKRVTVEHGDHYQPMIDEGIPQALEWFDSLQ